MKKYGLKYFIVLLPFLAAIFIELFVLPIDFFTFRNWETLVKKYTIGGFLKGPFYPNMTIVKTEEGGDLKASPACAIRKKDLAWQTDAYGYRNAASTNRRYPIIIVGDSNTAGTGLYQGEMLSEVLEKRLGKDVYPLAPDSIKYVFKHGLLKQTKPEVIILANMERGIPTANYSIRDNYDFNNLNPWEKILWSVILHPAVQSVVIQIDRVLKANMLNFIKARINSKQPPRTDAATGSSCPNLFFYGAEANKDIPDGIRKEAVRKIKNISDFFTGKGVRFIFLPIPNKENFYHRELNTPKPVFLEKLIGELRALGVEVVDTQKAFDEIGSRTDIPLYPRDDTHWNAKGAEVAALLIEEVLRTPPPYLTAKQGH